MTLADTFLKKLADWRPTESRQVLSIPNDGTGWSAGLTADRCDVLGCLLWELALQRATPADPDNLRPWAEKVARRATGLLEPLTVVEVDALRGEALLRSLQPAQRGEELFYYEVLLQAAGAALVRRYQASHRPDNKRQQVPFVLTHEALAKLAGDLSAES